MISSTIKKTSHIWWNISAEELFFPAPFPFSVNRFLVPYKQTLNYLPKIKNDAFVFEDKGILRQVNFSTQQLNNGGAKRVGE